MAAVKGSGNKTTELKLIAIFRRARVRGWRRNQKLPGKPDFVFHRERLAIFVDGCFWHGCATHFRMPESSRGYWEAKIARNVARDFEVRGALKQRGWRVLRFWEHELSSEAKVVRKIGRALRRE